MTTSGAGKAPSPPDSRRTFSIPASLLSPASILPADIKAASFS